jgi:pSer/pThr/pTyr-binding forkhead associated (FHA) protein
MLGIGDRSSVLTYKRAIDHGINVSPIAHRLFDPDFKLDAWLDQQGVPPAILGIQKIQRTQKTLTQSQSAKSAAPPMENKAPVRGAISQPDGSLLLPGNNKVLSAQLFKQTRQGPTLILVTPDSSKVFPLVPETKISIGREKTCDIQLNDITISRRHAEIFSTPSGFHIRDLGSSNGVKVNQTRIANAYHLSSGDCITLSNNVNIYFTSPSVSQPLPRLVQPKQQVTNSITTLTAIAPPATANGQACPGCGKNCPVNARFCANCGRTL